MPLKDMKKTRTTHLSPLLPFWSFGTMRKPSMGCFSLPHRRVRVMMLAGCHEAPRSQVGTFLRPSPHPPTHTHTRCWALQTGFHVNLGQWGGWLARVHLGEDGVQDSLCILEFAWLEDQGWASILGARLVCGAHMGILDGGEIYLGSRRKPP